MLKLLHYSIALFAFFSLCNCNKITYQLPDKEIEPTQLSVSGLVNGSNVVDFIFEQIKNANSDTVWLSVKNNTANNISDLNYVIELCRAVPQNYANCNLELASHIPAVLKPDSTLKRIYKWINKDIKLDSDLINAGIISFSNYKAYELANVYNSIYAAFETDTSHISYYGNVRGYIFCDGVSIFRLTGKDGSNYNATGLFAQAKSFDGLLNKDEEILTPFSLYPIIRQGNAVWIDTSSDNLKFRLQLQTPLENTINYISINTQKYF